MTLTREIPDPHAKPGQDKNLFQPLPFFMVRTPLLSIEKYKQLTESGKPGILGPLIDQSHDPVVREAIAVASLSLLDSLPNLTNMDQPRKQDQAIKGFLRYMLRMTTRPTPYGLCSAVGFGRFGNKANVAMGEVSGHQKQSRPDMSWLMQMVRKLEADLDLVLQLRVRSNSMVYFTGSRAKLPYVTRYGQREIETMSQMESASIRLTPVVQFVLQEAERPVLFCELADRVKQKYPDTPDEKIIRFLWQMFQQEFLISELRPPLMIESPFDYLRERLANIKGIDEEKQSLQAIAEQLDAYDRLEIGEGEAVYRKLVAQMRSLADAKNPIQVDLSLNKQAAELPHGIGEEVAKAAEVLWLLSVKTVDEANLEAYREEFTERYGLQREVPLLELLDPDLGLGAPAGYEYPPSRRRQEIIAANSQLDALLLLWMTQALHRGEIEVELTEDHIQQLVHVTPDNPKEAPMSLELYFTIASPDKSSLEQGNYRLILGPNPGSQGAGKTFGRFVRFMTEQEHTSLAEIQKYEQSLHPDAVFAEVVYLPNAGRAANVALSTNIRPYEVVMGTNPSEGEKISLPLTDLMVGSTMDHFYLKSKSLGQEVIPVTLHMLNFMHTPNVYRFLRELSIMRTCNWKPFTWGSLEHAPMCPRLRYGRTVLSLARWKLDSRILACEPKVSDERFRQLLAKWRSDWNVPQYVYLTMADHRIFLDLDHPLHVRELQRDFAKLNEGQALTLTEAGAELDEHWAESPDGHHLTEVVFPLVRTVPTARETSIEQIKQSRLPFIPQAERQYMPGSNWMFLKLYGLHSREEEFIGFMLRTFCEGILKQGKADQFFFMRYADPEPHIRLRFHGNSEHLTAELLPEVYRWALYLQQEGLLTRLVVDTYEPEIERYGGPALIGLAESVFATDSQTTALWLGLKRTGQIGLSMEMIGTISVIDIMEQFNVPFADQLKLLDSMAFRKEYLEEFRKERRLYLSLGDSFHDWENLLKHRDGKILYEGMKARRHALRQYQKAVRDQEEDGLLYNSFYNILSSMIHLHLNRLLGIDRRREKKVLTLALHTLYNLQYIRGNRKAKENEIHE